MSSLGNPTEDVFDGLVVSGEIPRYRADDHPTDLTRRQEQARFMAVLPGYTVIGDKSSPSNSERLNRICRGQRAHWTDLRTIKRRDSTVRS